MARGGSKTVTVRTAGLRLSGAGAALLDRRLSALQTSAEKGAMIERGIRAGADVLADGMARRSPSRRIAANIVVEYVAGTVRTALARIGPSRARIGKKLNATQLAYYLEFGVKAHRIPKRRRRKRKRVLLTDRNTVFGSDRAPVEHPGMPAKPFIRPTIDEDSEKALRAAGAVIWNEIEREAKKV